jgi:hypothetical protein
MHPFYLCVVLCSIKKVPFSAASPSPVFVLTPPTKKPVWEVQRGTATRTSSTTTTPEPQHALARELAHQPMKQTESSPGALRRMGIQSRCPRRAAPCPACCQQSRQLSSWMRSAAGIWGARRNPERHTPAHLTMPHTECWVIAKARCDAARVNRGTGAGAGAGGAGR